jgi:phage terminase large subunit-like protein
LFDSLLAQLGAALAPPPDAAAGPVWEPEPYQVMPEPSADWTVFMILGGRGAGKTIAGAHAVLDELRRDGPQARIGVGAPTRIATVAESTIL